MMGSRRLIVPAGVWEHDLPVAQPCTVCGEPGQLAYTTNEHDELTAPFCSLRHWAKAADDRVEITGEMKPISPYTQEAAFQDHQWNAICKRWPERGAKGISQTKNAEGHDVLLYRDERGRLLAALSRTQEGRLNVMVDPDHRGKGIGRALVRAAGRQWPIDLSVQTMTPAGIRLVNHINPRKPS